MVVAVVARGGGCQQRCVERGSTRDIVIHQQGLALPLDIQFGPCHVVAVHAGPRLGSLCPSVPFCRCRCCRWRCGRRGYSRMRWPCPAELLAKGPPQGMRIYCVEMKLPSAVSVLLVVQC